MFESMSRLSDLLTSMILLRSVPETGLLKSSLSLGVMSSAGGVTEGDDFVSPGEISPQS